MFHGLHHQQSGVAGAASDGAGGQHPAVIEIFDPHLESADRGADKLGIVGPGPHRNPSGYRKGRRWTEDDHQNAGDQGQQQHPFSLHPSASLLSAQLKN
jgi:hypothetical protein